MIGHNSDSATILRSYIDQIERLEEDKKNVADFIKEVFSEAKSAGFDAKIMRKMIALRKKQKDEAEEEKAMIDLYCNALGMTPLEQAIEAKNANE